MAWSNPSSVSAGSVLTASKWNQEVVDNTTDLRARDGLVLLNTTTISASAWTIDGVFTANFTNYLLIARYYGSAAGAIRMRLRASGTASTTAYYLGTNGIDYGTTVTNFNNNNSAYWDGRIGLANNSSTTVSHSRIELYGPQLAVTTGISGQFSDHRTTGSIGHFSGFHNSASAYDGFLLEAASGTLTGTISVFGYAK